MLLCTFLSTWAVISLNKAFFTRSNRRTLPSWQPEATSVPFGWKAAAWTAPGCGKLRVGVADASFQTCTALSALAVYIIALSAAIAMSWIGSAAVYDCTGLR